MCPCAPKNICAATAFALFVLALISAVGIAACPPGPIQLGVAIAAGILFCVLISIWVYLCTLCDTVNQTPGRAQVASQTLELPTLSVNPPHSDSESIEDPDEYTDIRVVHITGGSPT